MLRNIGSAFSRNVSPSLLPLVLLFLSACVTGTARETVTPARDVPERFMVVDGTEARAARSGEGCRNPMLDPRTDTRVMLHRSTASVGDYIVPSGAYGAGPRMLLRIDCATGAPIGLVRR